MPNANSCDDIVKHLNRIQGQIEALKKHVAEKRSCEDVAHLTKSIVTSFSSVRAGIIEHMLREELGEALNERKRAKMNTMLSLFKS
jgi:DNA-binding FrmR family transcriptional regulator